jgi:hypothetical protein
MVHRVITKVVWARAAHAVAAGSQRRCRWPAGDARPEHSPDPACRRAVSRRSTARIAGPVQAGEPQARGTRGSFPARSLAISIPPRPDSHTASLHPGPAYVIGWGISPCAQSLRR